MPQKVVLTITYTLNEDGSNRTDVSGPIHDETLCYGMLEKAKMTIHDDQPRIQAELKDKLAKMKAAGGFPGGGLAST